MEEIINVLKYEYTQTLNDAIFTRKLIITDAKYQPPKKLLWNRYFEKIALLPKYRKAIKILNEAIVNEANLKNLCSECGKPLTLVRPGKYQCDNCVT